MRKIKKINGFLVVKFNDREKREYEGTALGEYGVIDAEVYTGNLDIDRGAMEYDDADTLEVAVELARGLESEEDITDEPPTYTAAVETNESYTEEAVEPTALIEGWTRRLATQVKSKHYPDTDPRTAAHELYGFKMALHQIGFLPESEVITDPDTFGAGRLDGPMPRNPEELLAFVCDERCKNRAGHTQEELDAICAKCPLGQLYEDAEAQDLRIRERSERALQEHIEGVRHAEDTVTALLGGHEALAYEGITPYQAENIFRTNIQTAYNVGHYKQMTEPGVKALRPYWQYDAVNDSKTRPSHLAMDGRVFMADDPIWDTWFPPNGFKCRCTVKTLSKRQMEQRGLTVETEAPRAARLEDGRFVNILPDPQFDTNPAKVRYQPDLTGYPEPLKKAYQEREKGNTPP